MCLRICPACDCIPQRPCYVWRDVVRSEAVVSQMHAPDGGARHTLSPEDGGGLLRTLSHTMKILLA